MQPSKVCFWFITQCASNGIGSNSGGAAMPRILVVEDDPAFAAAAESCLRHAGFDVEIASDTIEALDRVDARDFDLFVVDVTMPAGKPNGLSFARMMGYRRPGSPVIFMSAYAEMVDVISALPAKALAKSGDLEVLVSEIKSQLAAKALPTIASGKV
jgi:DNA-binding response OmpR family regulator